MGHLPGVGPQVDHIVVALPAEIDYFAAIIAGLARKIDIEACGLVRSTFERKVDGFRCTLRTDAREHFVVARDLLSHDDSLVPIRI